MQNDNVWRSHRIDPKLPRHLSAVTSLDIESWDEWNVAKIYPVVDPYQTYDDRYLYIQGTSFSQDYVTVLSDQESQLTW